MFIASNTVSGSWKRIDSGTSTDIPQRFAVSAVLHTSGSFINPISTRNQVWLSGSLYTPKAGRFLQLKDSNQIVFYSKQVVAGDSKAASPNYLTHPLVVTLPIYYFESQGKATVVVFGEYVK